MNAGLSILVQYLPFNPLPYVPPFLLTPWPDQPPSYPIAMQDWLFPKEFTYAGAWTTSAFVDLPHVKFEDLDDLTLGVHGITPRTSHPVVPAPGFSSIYERDKKTQKAWEALYPKGSINPQGSITGGFGFYLTGPSEFKKMLQSGDVREVLFGYSVMFEQNFVWVKGGKLPGAFGGVGSSAYQCTGGRQHDRDKCFNLRLMWRKNGTGELYAYVPLNEENISQLSSVPPVSYQNPDYGFSSGRGAFSFKSGIWYTLSERVRLNDLGSTNGQIEIFVNGDSVINATGLNFRTSEDYRIQGLHFQTFFGGHSEDWASPKDQKAWFADVSGAIIIEP